MKMLRRENGGRWTIRDNAPRQRSDACWNFSGDGKHYEGGRRLVNGRVERMQNCSCRREREMVAWKEE